MKKRIISLLLVILIISAIPTSAFAATVNGKYVAGQGLYIMDFETGIELFEYNGDVPYVPASITKLMAMYLTYEAIENGEITLDTVVPISEKVYRLSRDTDYYNTVPLSYNDTYLVSELIDLILVYSASASVVAIAELIGGDEASFVARMNAKAVEWGIDATFHGCSGIEDNYITPKAVAILSRKFMMDYPEVLEITKKNGTVFHGINYSATNNLLNIQFYEGADGFKSGTTTNAGYCFVASAVRDGQRIITVVMKSTSKTQRYDDSHVLLDYGFAIRNSVVREVTMRLDPFTDVYKDDWFADSVDVAIKTGLMNGDSATTFSPNDNLNRAMAVTTLYRMAGSPQTTYKLVFDDVPAGTWYSEAITWAYDNSIIDGYGHESFGVNDPISRQQLAAILYRYAGYMDMNLSADNDLSTFGDTGLVSDWANKPLAWAVSNKIINGIEPTVLDPRGATSRAQYAVILVRFTAA